MSGYKFNPFTGNLDRVGTGFNTGQVEVDFGASEDGNASVTVSAAWVTSSSIITATPSGAATADHDPDDYVAEGIGAQATNIVEGVSFDIVAYPNETTWGKYLINYIGA